MKKVAVLLLGLSGAAFAAEKKEAKPEDVKVKISLGLEASKALYNALKVDEVAGPIIIDGGVMSKTVKGSGLVCTHTWTNGVEQGTATDGHVCEFTVVK